MILKQSNTSSGNYKKPELPNRRKKDQVHKDIVGMFKKYSGIDSDWYYKSAFKKRE